MFSGNFRKCDVLVHSFWSNFSATWTPQPGLWKGSEVWKGNPLISGWWNSVMWRDSLSCHELSWAVMDSNPKNIGIPGCLKKCRACVILVISCEMGEKPVHAQNYVMHLEPFDGAHLVFLIGKGYFRPCFVVGFAPGTFKNRGLLRWNSKMPTLQRCKLANSPRFLLPAMGNLKRLYWIKEHHLPYTNASCLKNHDLCSPSSPSCCLRAHLMFLFHQIPGFGVPC